MSAQTIAHIKWVVYDSDGNATGKRTASADSLPHAYTLPDRPQPKKNTDS